jgi:hypothetical protein
MGVEIPPAWLAAYPGTRFVAECRLLTWHPSGVLNLVQAAAIVHWLHAVEPALGTFNRFANLSRLNTIHLSEEDIAALAAQRKGNYRGAAVTTVLLASTPLSYAIGALYKRLMSGSAIQIHAVGRLASACRLLDVSPDVLLRQS